MWVPTLKEEDYPEVPSHPAVTRRQQFGLKDDLKDVKQEKKKNRKGKSGKSTKAKKKGRLNKNKNKKARKNQGKAAAKQSASQEVDESMPSPKKTSLKVEGTVSRGLGRLRKAKKAALERQGQEMSGGPTIAAKSVHDPPEPAEVEIASSSFEPKSILKKGKKNSRKAPPKNGKKKAKADPRDKGAKPAKVSEKTFDHYVLCIDKVLEECKSTDCAHEMFDGSVPQDFKISCYWTRDACGVKVSNSLLNDQPKKQKATKKPKKEFKSKNISQIAYFADGGCVYVNIRMAQVFVPWSLVVLRTQVKESKSQRVGVKNILYTFCPRS